MADISASDVKNLREKTGAGMMECKKALVETNGDFAKAEKLLKERGLAAMEKRSDRATSEGRIFVKTVGDKVVFAELTCETDFVAKNEDFVKCGETICDKALAANASTVTDELSSVLVDLAQKIRENMKVARVKVFPVSTGSAVATYVHSDYKTASLVILKVDPASVATTKDVTDFAYDCCLHLAAFTPEYTSRAQVPPDKVAEQESIFLKQVEGMDKPDKVKQGIVQGKVNKYFADICFVDQLFVKDDKVSVAKKMDEVGKRVGAKLAIDTATYWRLGA
jgi:elongation factor Ts